MMDGLKKWANKNGPGDGITDRFFWGSSTDQAVVSPLWAMYANKTAWLQLFCLWLSL